MRVFIDGEAGTTGLGIRQRLNSIAGIAVKSLSERWRKDQAARVDLYQQVDCVVLCLPDQAAREAVALADGLGDAGPRLIDASTAHRLAPGWVFGFPELTAEQPHAIAHARRVANPGCYPTGAIALLRPLIDAGLLSRESRIAINAVSGYSGGGKAMIAAHQQQGGPAFALYGLSLDHKHVDEIQHYATLVHRPIFVPSVAHAPQGMLVSIPLFLDALPGRPSGGDLTAALRDHYAGTMQVVVAEPSETLTLETLAGTDRLELRVQTDAAQRQAVLVARLDNLGKGASGAAVQNLRLMFGLPDSDA